MAANAAAINERLPADLVFCNHVLPGGAVGAATGAPFAVKAHGSELEYSIRGAASWPRLRAPRWRRQKPSSSAPTTSGRCWRTSSAPFERVHEVPPGVDVEEFIPQPRDEALRDLLDECRRDPPNPQNANERMPDEGNAERLERFLEGDKPTVLYFGKLLYNKGVHLLLEALHGLDARAVIVGFGDYRERLEQLAPQRTLFTGQLEHRHLVHLIPLADVVVVPSIFPEAFGMVAAEAAAAGCPPIVARHSGLAEVAEGLEDGYGEAHRGWPRSRRATPWSCRRRSTICWRCPWRSDEQLGAAARRVAVERWSWESVAQRLLEPFQ